MTSTSSFNAQKRLDHLLKEAEKIPVPSDVQHAIVQLKKTQLQIIECVNGTIFMRHGDGSIDTQSLATLRLNIDHIESSTVIFAHAQAKRTVAEHCIAVRTRYCQYWNITGVDKEAICRAAYERAKKIMQLNNLTLG